MSDKRPRKAGWTLLTCLTIAAWCGSAQAQSTAPFDALDNVEGDFVNLNAPPVRPMAMTADNASLFALNTHASRILHFNLSSGASMHVFHTAKSPVSIGLWTESGASPGDRLVVVCRDTYALLIHDRASGDVLELLELRDPTTNQILGEPGDLLIDQAANRAFVSCQAADAVAEIDLTGPSVVRVFRLPCKNPLFMCFDGNNDVLVAPLLSGNNSGARRRYVPGINPMHDGPTVVDFETAAQGGTQLPDEDLFRLIRSTGLVQALTTDVGTVQFAVGINPATGHVWQLNTDANNKDPNKQTEASIQGDIVKNQLSISRLPAVGQPRTTPLTQIDLDTVTGGYDPGKSVGQPYALAFGQFGFAVVAGLLTDNVMLLTSAGGYVSEFNLDPGSIPRALLYSPVHDRVLVYCWGTNTIDVRQVGMSWTPVFNLSLGLDPTPDQIKTGRAIAYSAAHSAKNNASCLSCHIDGRTDMVVWNLSSEMDDKGPMVTQTLDGIEKTVPFHWRGEQRNNLADFNEAFVKLLGASAPLNPTQFSDFEAFVLSLQTPPNPFEDETRVVNSDLQPVAPPTTLTANAVHGKTFFNAACEFCHHLPIATNNDTVPDGFNFGDLNPRRKFVKVIPFNEVYRKDQDADILQAGMQLHTVQLQPLSGPGTEYLSYPLLGVGVTHAGLAPSIHEFLSFFTSSAQTQLNTTAFVQQFDQGIAPAAYRAVFLDEANLSVTWDVLEDYFVPQAVDRNCDIVLFGKYTDGGSLVPMRWWFDRRLAEDDGQFVPEDGGRARALPFFFDQLENDQATLTCIGLPVGTGEGFGIDFDRDQLLNLEEIALNPATDPDVRDSDGDEYWDGHEVDNGGDPMDPSVKPDDTTDPSILRAFTQFVTTKVARINVETDELCTIQASYSFSGGPPQTAMTQTFAKTHSLVLSDLRARTDLNAINYTVTLTAIDLAGRPSSPTSLGPIATRSIGGLGFSVVVGSLEWSSMSKAGGTMTATATIRVDDKASGPTPTHVGRKRVVARIFKNDVLESTWTPDGNSMQLTGFDMPDNNAYVPFDAFPGPFLVSQPTDGTSGETTLDFTLDNLSQNDKITLNIELIGEEAFGPQFSSFTFLNGSEWNMPSTPAPLRLLVEDY